MEWLTYKEISTAHHLSFTELYRRVNSLKIKGKRVGKEICFNEDDVFSILSVKRKNSFTNNRRKLSIIEMYQKLGSASAVSRTLNINKKAVLSAVNEYLTDGTITVDSKINAQIKGKEGARNERRIENK